MSESGSALSYYGHGFGGGGEGHGAGGEGGEGVGRLLEEIVERDGIAQIDPVDVLVSGERMNIVYIDTRKASLVPS